VICLCRLFPIDHRCSMKLLCFNVMLLVTKATTTAKDNTGCFAAD
jgi:hypothetical protein